MRQLCLLFMQDYPLTVVIYERKVIIKLTPGTGAGHGGAEEDVDDEHHEEEDAEGHAEV